MMNPYLMIFTICVLSLAAAIDLRARKIPNVLTYSAMVVGLAYHSGAYGLQGLAFSAGGLLVGMALLIGPYLLGIMGAGDTKLMAAMGSILGPIGVFYAFLFTGIIGGIYAAVVLIGNRRFIIPVLGNTIRMLATHGIQRQPGGLKGIEQGDAPRLCYGVAIAVGTLCSILRDTGVFSLGI
jgi:prepilin peptidase CpaA